MSKLKTIRVNATMYTFLYLDINVPESATEQEIWEKIKCEDMIDGGLMKQEEYGDWDWSDPYHMEFNPDADDYSECFEEADDD